MKMKLDLGKFKKVSQDDKIAVLRHPDGHMFHVAISALHPQNRKNLDTLEMYDGGVVSAKKKKKDEDQEPIGKQINYPGFDGKKQKKAKGGELEIEEMEPLEIEEVKEPKKMKTKDGLEIEEVDESEMMANGGQVGMEAIKKEKYDDKAKVAYADGGEIPYDQLIPQEQAANTPYGVPAAMAIPQQSMDSQAMPVDMQSVPVNIPGITQPPASQPMPEQQPVMSQAAEPDVSSMTPDPLHAYEMQREGIQKEAEAQQHLADEQLRIQQAQAAASMKMMNDYQQHFNTLNDERKALIQDIQQGQIDPSRYTGSMDFGQKAMTAIGLALGGVSAGMTGGRNVAADILQQQIDRDIEAQKVTLGKKETLLSANLRQFGNLQDAVKMTQIMQNDIVKNKLEQAIARAGNPMAKANGQRLLGELEAKTAPMVQEMAMKRMLPQLEAEAAGDQSKYEQLIQLTEQINPKKAKELRDRYVPGVGFAHTSKDATDIKQMQSVLEQAKSGLNELMNISQKPLKSLNLADRARAKVIQGTLVGMLRLPITGPGAMSEGERKMLEDLIANPTDIFSLDFANRAKLKALEQRLEQSTDALIKARGLNPENKFNPQQRSFIEWARKNPNDPRSQMVLKKLGLQ